VNVAEATRADQAYGPVDDLATWEHECRPVKRRADDALDVVRHADPTILDGLEQERHCAMRLAHGAILD